MRLYIKECFVVFFFFKQKTAYEMRISDWSSDGALPILRGRGRRDAHSGACAGGGRGGDRLLRTLLPGVPVRAVGRQGTSGSARRRAGRYRWRGLTGVTSGPLAGVGPIWLIGCGNMGGAMLRGRSEEHTSELQSLMRISYAVFCLKKK